MDTPQHYNKTIQPWDAMQSWMSEESFRGFLQGNIIKYIARHQEKGGVADLKKALHYLTKLISTYTEGSDGKVC